MLFITETLEQEEAAKREFAAEGFELNSVGVSWYLGEYLGTREVLEVWVRPLLVA